MPGLLRAVARTAVVAGTATAVSNRVSRRQAERWQQQGSYPYGQQAPVEQEPQYQEPRYEQPPPPQQDMVQQLKDLAELKDQGILTEQEFATQKARILGS
jgi:Short C-terminal domain